MMPPCDARERLAERLRLGQSMGNIARRLRKRTRRWLAEKGLLRVQLGAADEAKGERPAQELDVILLCVCDADFMKRCCRLPRLGDAGLSVGTAGCGGLSAGDRVLLGYDARAGEEARLVQ